MNANARKALIAVMYNYASRLSYDGQLQDLRDLSKRLYEDSKKSWWQRIKERVLIWQR